MATEFNLYVSPLELRSDWGPIRPAEVPRAFIYGPWDEQWNLHWPIRNKMISLVGCEPTLHQTIQADPDILRVWPVVSVPWTTVVSHYATPLTSIYTGGQLTTLCTALEGMGFDTGWTSASTTFRDLLRRLSRHVYVVQRTDGDERNEALRTLHGLALTATVSSIPAGTRTAISAWMQNKGMAVAWITGTTTVRQVLRYVAENMSGLPNNFGLLLDRT